MVTQERLQELLSYDPHTGVFRWKRRVGRANVGDLAGSEDNGYVRIRVCGRLYMAHVLAWFYVYGSWPSFELDHKDLDRSNNRISNLRPATHGQNGSNTLIRANNTSGYKGVTYSRAGKKWLARLMSGRVLYHLGYYHTARDAAQAYLDKSRELRGEFHRD